MSAAHINGPAAEKASGFTREGLQRAGQAFILDGQPGIALAADAGVIYLERRQVHTP